MILNVIIIIKCSDLCVYIVGEQGAHVPADNMPLMRFNEHSIFMPMIKKAFIGA